MEQHELIRLICILASRHYHEMASGNMSPGQMDVATRLRNPRPGDLVVENSSIFRGNWERRLGRLLILKRKEVANTETLEEDGEEVYDEFTYIESLDGKLQRWWNCHFTVVAEDMNLGHAQPPVPEPDRSEWLAKALKRHGLSA